MVKALEVTNPATLEFFKTEAPVRRMGVPEDLTPLVCYLLSDASSFVTGSDMLITGSWELWQKLKVILLTLNRWHPRGSTQQDPEAVNTTIPSQASIGLIPVDL